VFNNLLYMIYKSPNNNDLNYAYFDGYAWHGNSEIYKQLGGIRPQSDSNPGLAVFKGRLHMSYKGPHNDDLNIAYFDGSTWSGNTEIFKQPPGLKPVSNYSPTLVEF
jgi:prepilin-type processing-associated H-X9-DG protein